MKILTNSLAYVRGNPELFLDDGNSSLGDLAKNLVNEAKILEEHSPQYHKENNAHFIYGLTNNFWQDLDLYSYFNRINSFPKKGANCHRQGIIINAFSENVGVKKGDVFKIIKGEFSKKIQDLALTKDSDLIVFS